MLQEAADDPLLQHDALYVQHGDDDEGEGQHALLIPTSPRHVVIHGEESHTQRAPSRSDLLSVLSYLVI